MFPFAQELNLAGWFYIAYVGLFLPLMTMRGAGKLRLRTTTLPNRVRHFQSTAFMLGLITFLALMVARVEWIALFPREFPSWKAIAAGVVMYIVAVACMRPRWRKVVEKRGWIVHLFMPSNNAERAWWIGVAILAGVGEEIAWRGVLAALVGVLTGNWWLAAVLCSISFALAHWVQGWQAAAVIFFFSLGFHALVWIGGSLYVAMAVHAVYDITAGLTYGRLGKELGWRLETDEPKPTASA